MRASVTVNGKEVGADLRRYAVLVLPADDPIPGGVNPLSAFYDGTGTTTLIYNPADRIGPDYGELLKLAEMIGGSEYDDLERAAARVLAGGNV
jgi:hypothetical protein